jgi:tetratricopeptide (TPR) repeat protein
MVSAAIDIETWQECWAAAQAAGRTAAAIQLTASVVETYFASAQPYFEVADFLFELQHNLGSLDRLYQQHREAFGLAPEDLTWHPPQFPIARAGLAQVVSLLRVACSACPENAGWQDRLADALDRLGETDQAIQRREDIATIFPHFQENQWALLKVLERTGDYICMSRYGERLVARAAFAPEPVLAQARIHDRFGKNQIAHLLCERLRTRLSLQNTNSPEQIDFLFRLAWTATRDGLPTKSEELKRDLRWCCAATAEGNFNDAKARLACGYACLINGDTGQTKEHFAIASWIANRNGPNVEYHPTDAFSSALRYARAFLLDLAPPPTSRNEAPYLQTNELALAHSYWLHKSGRIIDALTELARWRGVVPDVITPLMPRTNNDDHVG